MQIEKELDYEAYTEHFFLLTTLFIMASCGEDRSGEYYALIGENVWIEQIMKEHYLWYDSIPAIKETDYFAEPEDFLQNWFIPRHKTEKETRIRI